MKQRIHFNMPRRYSNEQGDGFRIHVRNATSTEPAELLLMDFVGKDFWTGEGITSKDVVAFLNSNRGRPVSLRINSGGGEVFEGLGIYNALIAHNATITTTIEGLAASIASVIAMAGDKIRIFESATMMSHRAHALAIGNAADMKDMANTLELLDGQIAGVYASRTGKSKAKMLEMMVGEGVDGTWFDAQQALANRLVDEIIPNKGRGEKNSNPRQPPGASARLRELRRYEEGQRAARLRQIERDARLAGAGA